MDLRQQQFKATRIQTGMQQEYRRKYVGQFYINLPRGRVAHVNDFCSSRRVTAQYERLPVYEEDGTWYWQKVEEKGWCEPCTNCPPVGEADLSWKEQGACYDVKDDGFFDPLAREHKRVIKTYCEPCPVQRECFEYGTIAHWNNMGSVWGGVYLPVDTIKRKKAMDDKRRELDA